MTASPTSAPWVALAVWTVAVGSLAALLGGAESSRDALTGAEFSIVAAVVTAFGISVVQHAADDFRAVVATALAGSTWLLLVTGAMFTVGRIATGGSITASYIAASLNHAPAVWTVVSLAIVAWSFRPAWSAAGWGVLGVFVAIGQIGEMIGAPQWLIQFSPYARISLMPAERFDLTSTLALTAGCCVLLATAAYNHGRRDLDVIQGVASPS